MYNFQSDYLEGCAPEILEELIRVNYRQSEGYGKDEYCLAAADIIRKKLEREDVDVHFITGGTPCNTLAATLLKPYEAYIAADTGHINVHETGAIEATGHKVIETKGQDGKIDPDEIIRICESHTDEHMVKPRMVFISNPSELGTIYSLAELKWIRKICDKYGLYFYMDGARLGTALTAKGNDVTLKDIAELCDLFYIGGTKNGALLGEAMVIVKEELKENFRYLLKQRGQMLAKGRIMGVSFKVLMKDDLYLKLAKHANKTASALSYVFDALGIEKYVQSPTNQQFVILSDSCIRKLQEKYIFSIWGRYDKDHSIVRFVTSWATKDEAVLDFAQDLKASL